MKFGICHLSVVPCRLEPSDKSEMVTQLLFGETVKIYEEKRADWRKIKTSLDNYECWVDKKQIIEISEEEYEQLNENDSAVSNELIHVIANNVNNELTPIVLGSSLPNLTEKSVRFGPFEFTFDGSSNKEATEDMKETIVEHSFMYLNTPYLWGGRSPLGIDCSGFTQVVYKTIGINLPRDAYQQATVGQTLSFVEESEAGDLAFFDNDEGHIIHVGIVLENNRIIHASGKVRIDKLDHQGIFNTDTNRYSHRLRLIKKVID